ncbi:MAG TPA: AAA family ATPase [Ramlibacter sp.]
MKLSRVGIQNFRSIANLNLEFEFGCQTLIGINESGKSNLLRALHLLDPEVNPTPADLRIERHDEPQVTSGHVRFTFQLNSAEIDEVIQETSAHFAANHSTFPLITDGKQEKSLAAHCRAEGSYSPTEGVYSVGVPSGKRSHTAWARPETEKIVQGWYRNKTASAITLPLSDSTEIVVPAMGYVFAGKVELSASNFEEAQIAPLTNLISTSVKQIVQREFPKCIFWKYADKYLLPSSVDVAQFCASPDSCVPLKSMFELAGYSGPSIAATITNAQSQGHHRYLQVLEKTGAKATDHIRAVWRDYKTVRLKLESHGSSISPIVTDDEVPLDMTNRSDGFKRFVSFLLQISAKVRTSELANALILIDEPEIALHPSGARSLLGELIEIGNTNTVVFSTHSIFMIDKTEIARHLVVEKKKEVTTTWRAEKSRIQDEEVLYSAIGYSIFETLKERNVIFEGWRDKRLFEVVAGSMARSDKTVKEKLSAIGFTFAEGVKDIRNVAHFLQLAARPCVIISDADKPALQHRKAYQNPGAWGEWKTLQDIIPGTQIFTGEDLIMRAAIVKRANKFASQVAGLAALAEDFFQPTEATVSGLKRWLETAGLAGAELEEALGCLKNAMFADIKRADLVDHSEELVRFVLSYDFAAKE